MKAKIIQIGNSKGLRLSKTILEKYQIGDSVDLVMEEDCIILKPIKTTRESWSKAFEKMHNEKGDSLIIPDVFEDDTIEEWD